MKTRNWFCCVASMVIMLIINCLLLTQAQAQSVSLSGRFSGLIFNRTTGTYNSTLTISNYGSTAAYSTIKVVVQTGSPAVSVSGAVDGVKLSLNVPGGVLNPGQVVSYSVAFNNPSRIVFSPLISSIVADSLGVHGRVTERATGLPIAGVTVTFPYMAYSGATGPTVAVTDSNGNYAVAASQLYNQLIGTTATTGILAFTKAGYYVGVGNFSIASGPATQNVSLAYGGTVLQGVVTDSATGVGIPGANLVLSINCQLAAPSCISPNDNYVRLVTGAGGSYAVDASKLLDPNLAGSLTGASVAYLGTTGYFGISNGSFTLAPPYPNTKIFTLKGL